LNEKGYQVLSAASVEEALKLFEENQKKISLLLTDVVLPDRNGLDLANELTKIFPQLPVILSSGYTGDKGNWDKIQRLGYQFLKKPYSMNELLNAIYQALYKSRSND
jgi:DNA-binding NtrC family response regulator